MREANSLEIHRNLNISRLTELTSERAADHIKHWKNLFIDLLNELVKPLYPYSSVIQDQDPYEKHNI